MLSFRAVSKKISATLLLCLFLFIHAEKAFHQHKQNNSELARHGSAFRNGDGVCEICDFQAARDADLPVLAITNAPVEIILIPFVSPASTFHSAESLEQNGRGPPAQA
jgi:hypothetical protein